MPRSLALLFIAFNTLSAAPPPPAGWTEGYVLSSGIRLHYWRTGGASKTPLVMAHGSSDDGLCWTNLAKELTGQYDVIMFDARGHGLSDPPKPGDPADAQVEDLAGLIRELKLSRPVVMGHSMGSSSAAWFGAKYPDVARAIVLEDPALVRRPGVGPAPSTAPPEKRRADTLARNNQSEAELVEGCMRGSPKWGLTECEIWAPSKRRHHPDTALVNNAGRPAIKEIFSKITVPVLILKADAQGELRRENKTQTLEALTTFLQELK